MATSTEVEGDTTVDVTGLLANGESLKDLAEADSLENQTAESEDEESESKQEEQAGEPEQTGKKDSEPSQSITAEPPRKERRMEKLIDKLKERTDEVSELRKQIQTIKPKAADAQPEIGNMPPWMQPSPEVPAEITPEQYTKDVAAQADAIVNTRLSQYQENVEKLENFKDDLRYVESKYAQLNPDDAEHFNPVQAQTIARLYDTASKADQKLRLKDFVDQVMSFHQAGQAEGKKEVTEKTLQREADMAVTPSATQASREADKVDWDSMSLKDKEAWMKANGVWDY